MVAGEPREQTASPAVAIIDGRPLRRDDVLPLLLEIGGAQALTEAILDQRLADEAVRQGIEIGEEELAREEELLAKSLETDADSTARLLETMRAGRGLGPVRYQALLRRNALLRALVQPEIVTGDEDVAAQFDMVHGEKRQARIITVATLARAIEVTRRLGEGESFNDLAVEVSTDSSAARGGLLAPISRADLSYPDQVRATLWMLQPHEVSSPVMLDGSFAILKCEKIIPADETTLEEIRAEMEELARRRKERILMEALAQRLLEGASITILDAELERQWNGIKD